MEGIHGICSIFAAPFLKGELFAIDWLHAVDQGVAADFAGNLLYSLLHKALNPESFDTKTKIRERAHTNTYLQTAARSRAETTRPGAIRSILR